MRVLHVISGLPRAAGTSVFCVELCNHLSLQGVACCIAVHQKSESDVLPHSSVPVFEVAADPSALSFKPDLVHIHALWDPFLHRFATWARKNQIPLVFSPHGMLTPWALGQKRLKKWLALALYQYRDLRGAALIHVTAESELADVRRLGLKQPVVVAPLGVNVSSKAPPLRSNNPKIALFVSRVHPKKGLFNLVDAWASLKNSVNSKPLAVNGKTENRSATVYNSLLTVNGIPWRCVIAGPDQDGHAAEVMERARTAGIEGDFEMVGPVFGRDKDELYRKADLFVLPTYSENFGVVVIEALAHGCPVITTKGAPWQELENCGNAGLRECLNEGGENKARCNKAETILVQSKSEAVITQSGNKAIRPARAGWWIDIGVEPLTEALEEAIGLSDEERRAMGENGQKLVEAKYTWPAIAEQMKAAYTWILNGGQPPPCVRVS